MAFAVQKFLAVFIISQSSHRCCKRIKGLLLEWNVVNVTFHFVHFFLAFYSNSVGKIRFVSTLRQLNVSNRKKNKFIHAKNLPNRINIFIYEFIFGAKERENEPEKLCLH